MSFKVSKPLVAVKVAGVIALSYFISWGAIILFFDTAARFNPFSPIDYWQVTPKVFYYAPISIISVIALISTVINSYIPDDYGDAREASDSDIKEMGLFAETGLILGVTRGWLFRKYIRTKETLSAFLIAPPGTGKTMALVVPNLLSCTWSMFINDVKGELWDLTSKQRAKMGRVGLFAPTLNLGKEKSLCFNPFAAECLPGNFDDQVDAVDELLTILYPVGEEVSETSRYFNANAKTLFMFWAMRAIVKNGETSLPAVYEDATDTGDMQAAIAAIMEVEKLPNFINKLGNSLLDMDQKEFKSTATSFTNMLDPFCRPNIRKYFEASDFSYKDFRQKKPFSLYVVIPPRDMARMRPIVQLMAQYLTNNLMSDSALFKQRNVTFMLDEFARLGFVPDLINAPELSRGCKMNFMYFCQSQTQIAKIYNKNGGDAMSGLMDVCDYKGVYTQNDQKTAERLSQLVGKTTRKRKSINKKFGDLTGSSSISTEGVPFITDQDLLNMGKDEMVVIVKDWAKRPIICKKPWLFKDLKMKKLVGAYNNLKLNVDVDDSDSEEKDDISDYKEVA